MGIIYPASCIGNDKNKIEYLYRLMKVMRDYHNDTGKKYLNGEMTKDQWETFSRWFEEHHNFINEDICNIREVFEKADITIKINEVFD